MPQNIINQMKKEHPEELSNVNDEYTKNLIIFKELIQSNVLDESNFNICHQWIQKLNKCKINETITRNYFLELLSSQLKTGQVSQPFTNLENLKKPLYKIIMKNKMNDFLSELNVEENESNIGDTENTKIKLKNEDVFNIDKELLEQYKTDFEDLLKFIEIEKVKFSVELIQINELKSSYENFFESNMLSALKQIAIEPDFSKIINSDLLTKTFEKFPNKNVKNELKEIELEIKNNFQNWFNEVIQKEQKTANEIYKRKAEEILEQNIKLFEVKLDENKREIKNIKSLLQNRQSNNSVGTQTPINSYNGVKNLYLKKNICFYENKLKELNTQKILEEKAMQISLAAKKGEILLEIGTKYQQDFEKFAETLKGEIYDIMKPVVQNEKNI